MPTALLREGHHRDDVERRSREIIHSTRHLMSSTRNTACVTGGPPLWVRDRSAIVQTATSLRAVSWSTSTEQKEARRAAPAGAEDDALGQCRRRDQRTTSTLADRIGGYAELVGFVDRTRHGGLGAASMAQDRRPKRLQPHVLRLLASAAATFRVVRSSTYADRAGPRLCSSCLFAPTCA